MIRVNVQDAKTHLSRYLAAVEAGETVVLCRRNVPIAELRSVEQRRKTPRPIGLAKGRFVVPEDINAPLPDEVLDLFEGGGRG